MKAFDKVIGIGGRKFLVVIVAILIVGIKDAVGEPLSPQTLEFLKWIVAAYVVGQSLADGLSKGATSSFETHK